MLFFHSDHWPDAIDTIRENLLNATEMGSMDIANKCNEFTILPPLLDAYRRHYPALAAFKETKRNEERARISKSSNHPTVVIITPFLPKTNKLQLMQLPSCHAVNQLWT